MSPEEYVAIIMNDDTERIVSETPTIYENARIEREYEFDDGAVVSYEWRDASIGDFNHRFTLTTLPKPNPRKYVAGVICTIKY